MGNQADYGAGICCSFHAHPLVINNVIAANTARIEGGGIEATWKSFPTVYGNTVADNQASLYGGAMMSYLWSAPVVKNSILWGNTEGGGYSLGYEVISYSDVEGGYAHWQWGAEGNLDQDPGFVDAAGGDYRLLPGSPCRDAGTAHREPCPSGSFGAFTSCVDTGPFSSDLISDPLYGANLASGFDRDLVGVARPQGAGYDLGAFEGPP